MIIMKSNSSKFFKNQGFRFIQMVFCCDTTGSMSKYIRMVGKTITEMVTAFNKLSFYQYEFAFVAYRDHCDQDTTYMTRHKNFTNGATITKFIRDQITTTGGGDTPEAVLDGLDVCAKRLSWKPKGESVKVVFHVADSPPHGKEYYEGWDSHPKGCPNGLTAAGVSKQFKNKGIEYVLLDCSGRKKNPLRLMICEFGKEKHFGYFDHYKIDRGIKMLDSVGKFLQEAFENYKSDFRIKIREILNNK